MKQHIIYLLSIGALFLTNSKALALTQEFSGKEIAHIVVNCEEATINMVGSSSSSSLKIQIQAEGSSNDVADWINLENTGDTIRLTDKPARPKLETSHSSKTSKVESKTTPHQGKIKIEISGISIPAEIHLLEGSVSVQRWSKEVYAHVQKGKVIAKENSSSLVVHVQKGEVNILNHQGKVIVDNVQASTLIKDLNGDLEVQSFLGDVNIEKVTGSLLLNSGQGNFKISSGGGSLQFDIVKGSLTTQGFDGRVEGHSQEGSVSILGSKDPDVNIRTHSGKVTINTAANSGALLNLSSNEGEIYVPAYLHVSREGATRSLRARLKGEAQKGSILVRSQDGNITVK
jgi:hypothetical protein